MTQRTLDFVIPALLALVLAPAGARVRVAKRLLTDWLEWTAPPPPLGPRSGEHRFGSGDPDPLRRPQYGDVGHEAQEIGVGATL
jgi:hypothetical protein